KCCSSSPAKTSAISFCVCFPARTCRRAGRARRAIWCGLSTAWAPWLHGIAAWIDATRRAGNHGVVACSALKRAYRDILIGERRDVRLVYLKGEQDLIARRLSARDGHFMPASLLDSQFAALEEPQADEHPIVLSIAPHPREMVEEIVMKLGKDAT